MPAIQLYDQLLQYPLFQGMSRTDLMQVVSRTKFNFIKFARGKRIVKEGDKCDSLYFLISGILQAETQPDDYSYTFVEQLSAPYIIQPESLFGLNQRYTGNYCAWTDVSLFSIDKKEVINLSDMLIVFRLNLINLYAAHTQRIQHQPWRRQPQVLEQRIIRFFSERCKYPAGPKEIRILRGQLAAELNDSSLDISRALCRMRDAGLIQLNRGRITIPAFEKLLM